MASAKIVILHVPAAYICSVHGQESVTENDGRSVVSKPVVLPKSHM